MSTIKRYPALVVTSINAPNRALRNLAMGAGIAGWRFIVIGDEKSPVDFRLDGCEFWSLSDQCKTDFRFARACPVRHYARKNIGYLLAAQGDASLIIETDDDNIPLPGFYKLRTREVEAPAVAADGWVNAYRYFTNLNIWPRGLPLDMVRSDVPEAVETGVVSAPIQQGLADDNPDVDAIYRLVLPLPVRFERDRMIALSPGSWCPFNSQNTIWWNEVWALMYLPAYCSFRMTDIWRSFVAQRIAWANGWSVLFTSPTVTQDRNDHDLNRDFLDEVPGYLNNARIARLLEAVPCAEGADNIGENMRRCYRILADKEIVGEAEPALLDVWLDDLQRCSRPRLEQAATAGAP